MKNNLKTLALISILSASLLACNKDKNEKKAEEEIENEIITTVQLTFTDSTNSNNKKPYNWVNSNGYQAGSDAKIDTIKLDNSKTYIGKILLLNTTSNPVDTISNEVLELKNEHQFFYENQNTSTLNINFITTDKDDNGVPLGLYFKTKTGAISKGNIRVRLKHQPDVKPKSGNGDVNLGSTDVEVIFPVIVQ